MSSILIASTCSLASTHLVNRVGYIVDDVTLLLYGIGRGRPDFHLNVDLPSHAFRSLALDRSSGPKNTSFLLRQRESAEEMGLELIDVHKLPPLRDRSLLYAKELKIAGQLRSCVGTMILCTRDTAVTARIHQR